MPTTRTVDEGDVVVTITGEPTWENPAQWLSVVRTPKPGTPDANRGLTLTALVDDLAAIDTLLSGTNAAINLNPAAVIKDLARMVKRLDRIVLGRHESTT